jgi:hypothetical protein
VTGSVFAQVIEAADADCGPFGGGRERDAVIGEQLAGDPVGVADGRAVDPEERAGGGAGEAEVVAEPDDQDMAGEVDAAMAAGSAAVADGVDAAAAAAEVAVPGAAGVGRDLQGCGQRGHVPGGQAGERGMVQGFPAGQPVRRCRLRFRVRVAQRHGVHGAVPVAVPVMAR